MAEETFQERTEQATPKRRQEAREKGQIPRSRELSTMAVLLASGMALLVFGHNLVAHIQDVMSGSFVLDREIIFRVDQLLPVLLNMFEKALGSLLPFFAAVFIVAVLSPLAIGGWVYSIEAMSFKWEKIDPVRGIKRIFSARSLMELFKALFKFLIVLGISISLIWYNLDYIYMVGKSDALTSIASLTTILLWAFLLISSSMVLIAMIDVPFQLWEYNKNLRMTKQEIREEMKQTDGSPELKRHLRNRQREISTRRMMQEVPKADVIITNPTHYAVALKYDQEKMDAPVVIAKGRDLVAQRIRELGRSSNIPILSAPPLSRALYFSTDIGHRIPDGLFLAVAQVLAFIYQIRRKHNTHYSEYSMDNLPIPEEYAIKSQ